MLARIMAGSGLVITFVALIAITVIFLTNIGFSYSEYHEMKSSRNFLIAMMVIFVGCTLFIVGISI